jgi:uncharacterized surface protein with fasciclin (FAS1) repeats
MKTTLSIFALFAMFIFTSCGGEANSDATATTDTETAQGTGQSGVVDETSNPNIVQVASGSPDHTTLVAGVKAAGLVDVLSNAGPFTVFGPTNAGFDKLPAGTLDNLLKPENQLDLKNILEYHTYVGVLKTEYMSDGQEFEMVNGGKIKIKIKDGKVIINDKATISSSITTSNGVIHVIDDVLLP